MINSPVNYVYSLRSPWSIFNNGDPWLYVSIVIFAIFALMSLVIHLRGYSDDDDTPKIFKAGYALLAMAWNIVYVFYKMLI